MADALAAEVERIATQLDRSMSWVICQAVREFLGRVDLPAGE
jgi:predicted transcriptional regulator